MKKNHTDFAEVKPNAFKKTQWAGGSFVEFDDCVKPNNNKEAQKGGCSTGAVDNVVKLKKTKGNVNAPSLNEGMMREALKLQRDTKENKLIIDSLKEGGTSLCLFHGDPGCGKTHYIRYLIAELCKEKKKVIYFPNEHIHFLSDPSFLHFFKDHKKSIIVIEDAEEILTSRELSLSNRGISNLLNLTDGLMGDFLELKFVCTFNTAIDKIDKALLRKGRITTNYKFEKLNVDKSNKLLKKLEKEHTTTEAMTLAEIYNLEQKDNSEKKERKIGF
jgi:DNA polymerase III delta prime subunit